MTEEEYKAYYLEAITEISDNYFVLNIRPGDYADIDNYHQIFIRGDKSIFNILKSKTGAFIFIDLLSATQLEVYEGEFYTESTSDGPLDYTSFESRSFEKTGRDEWKPKYNVLYASFKDQFDKKIKPYEDTRKKVVANYRDIYLSQMRSGKTFGLAKEEIDKTHLFAHLYNLFGEDSPGRYDLNEFIDPGFRVPKTAKDWKVAFSELKGIFNNLQAIDVSDNKTITDHLVKSYTRSFNYMLSNLEYNHKGIDEQKYIAFFEDLMNRLKENTIN